MSKLLKADEVMELLGISRVTLWAWEKEGKFPKGTRVSSGGRWLRYNSDKIEQFIKERSV
jgi:predicted DNA-binding transcriptional regulator AlpA